MLDNINPDGSSRGLDDPLNANYDNQTAFYNVNGTVYFTANNGEDGSELWSTQGSTGTTGMVADLIPGPEGSNPANFTNVNGTLYFTADDGINGRELWNASLAAPSRSIPGQRPVAGRA